MGPFKWIWQFIRKYRGILIFAIFMVLCSSAISMINPYLTGVIVDQVIQKGKSEMLIKIIAVMLGATILKSLVRWRFQLIFESVSQDIFREIRENIYIRLQELEFDFFDKTRTGDIMARMTGDMEAVRHFIAWVIYQVADNGIGLYFFHYYAIYC